MVDLGKSDIIIKINSQVDKLTLNVLPVFVYPFSCLFLLYIYI